MDTFEQAGSVRLLLTHPSYEAVTMSDDVKKAICLAVLAAAMSGAYCFGSYLDYLGVKQQESTKRMLSFDKKQIACAQEQLTCPGWKDR